MTHCNVGQYAALQWSAVPEVLCYVLAVIQMDKVKRGSKERERGRHSTLSPVAVRDTEFRDGDSKRDSNID